MCITVAPARERGLKLLICLPVISNLLVAPARERGLKWRLQATNVYEHRRSREGAWIEIQIFERGANYQGVAPARERGLKSTLQAS